MYSVSNSQIDELSTWKKSRSVSVAERRRVLKQYERNLRKQWWNVPRSTYREGDNHSDSGFQ